jgi:hypothetical protein
MAMKEPFPEDATIGDRYRDAMMVTSTEEARVEFERNIEWQARVTGRTRAEVEEIERANICYFAGYFSTETRNRVLLHFAPIFLEIVQRQGYER